MKTSLGGEISNTNVKCSAVFLGDLEKGEGEWRNMQLVVRRSFKDCFERMGRQQDTLDHLSKVVIGVNERLSTRVTTPDVLKLLESDEFKRKVKQDGHLQDRLDKLEYTVTRLGGLRAEVERKADIQYVDSSCAQKVDKTDISIRSLLSDTIKGDLSSVRAEVWDLRAKLNAQEAAHVQHVQTKEESRVLVSEMHVLARELGELKTRLDAYPGYSQLISIIERKADKSSLEAAISSAVKRASASDRQYDSDIGSGSKGERENGEVQMLKESLEALQRTVHDQSKVIASLQCGHYTNIGFGDGSLDVENEGEDSLVASLTPIKNSGKGKEINITGRDMGTSSTPLTNSPSNANQVILARLDSLALAVQALSTEREQLLQKVAILESQSAKAAVEREENASCILAANKLAARAEATVELSSRRVAALETVNQQRLMAVDQRVTDLKKRVDRSEKLTKSSIAHKTNSEKEHIAISKEDTNKQDKQDKTVKDMMNRVKNLESQVHMSTSARSDHDLWEQWRSSVLDHVHNSSKTLLHEVRMCQDALAAVNAGGKAMANSAYSRAEEAIDQVKRLRLAQDFKAPLSYSSPTAYSTSASYETHATPPFRGVQSNPYPTSHSPSVWIGDNEYKLESAGSDIKNNEWQAKEHVQAHANGGSASRTPLSATSAALDARIARLKSDKEDLRRLSKNSWESSDY